MKVSGSRDVTESLSLRHIKQTAIGSSILYKKTQGDFNPNLPLPPIKHISARISLMQQPSIFTRIINNEIPANKIYEDDRVVAFLEMYPLNEGHTLVVPRQQVDHIWDLSDEDYEYLWKTAKKIANHIRKVYPDAPRVGVVVEGFGVPHAHIHLIPIYKGDDLRRVQDHSIEPNFAELEEVAKRLKM